MYAVIRTGGKQYRVAENDRIVVERLAGEPGDTLAIEDVLMIADGEAPPVVGAPVIEKAAVFAEVVEQTRSGNKKKRRKNYRRTKGHRQDQTVLRITGISATGEKPKAKAKPKPNAEKAPEPAPEAETEPKVAEQAAPAAELAAEAAQAEPAAETAPAADKTAGGKAADDKTKE